MRRIFRHGPFVAAHALAHVTAEVDLYAWLGEREEVRTETHYAITKLRP